MYETFVLFGKLLYKVLEMSEYVKVLNAAHKFEDTELVSFLQKYNGGVWFYHTRQWKKALCYSIILDGIDVKSFISEGDNMLMLLTRLGGSPSSIKYLIQRGVDVNFVEPGGARATPLFTACRYGNYDTIKRLLDAGADPTCRCATHESALQVAFNFSSEESFLLMYDAIFPRKQEKSKLLQSFSTVGMVMQNIIMQTHGDRNMLILSYRVNKLLRQIGHMNPGELGHF